MNSKTTADVIAELRAYSACAGRPLVLELAADELALLSGGRLASAAAELLESLTGREKEILQLIAKGFTHRVIGDRLGRSHKTAEGHITTLFSKLDVTNGAEASVQAVRMGLA